MFLEQIVTLGMPSVSPIEKVGKYIKPKDWNALISDPDVVSSLVSVTSLFYLIINLSILEESYFES